MGVAPPHAAQAPPVVPQAPLLVPPTQVPLSQQPPLQALPGPHCWPQVCVVVLQASSGAQSAAELQPHAPARQARPLGLDVQSTHSLPAEPHCEETVPPTQVPFSQQPPLHGCSSEQPVPAHVWVASWQSVPAGQSAFELQPHTQAVEPVRGTQAWPPTLVEQSTQEPPLVPHNTGITPITQRGTAVSQHPGVVKPHSAQNPLH
jgi:hypothetical protein